MLLSVLHGALCGAYSGRLEEATGFNISKLFIWLPSELFFWHCTQATINGQPKLLLSSLSSSCSLSAYLLSYHIAHGRDIANQMLWGEVCCTTNWGKLFVFTSTERSMQSSNQWKGLIDTQLLKIPIKWLREMIEALLEHRIEKHPVSELSKAPGLAQALMDSREHETNAQTRNAAQDVMKLVISIYGERVSQALINGVSNDKEKFNWIIGQSSPAKQYEEILRTRAKDYYETKVNSKDIASQQRIRANLLNALTIDAWQNNGNPIAPTIFCVLSFACIWDAIASYVFTTGQLTEEEKEKINLIRDECHPHVPRLAETDTTSNEPSSIFEQNRQRAYHIIDDRLNRLLTDVNK